MKCKVSLLKVCFVLIAIGLLMAGCSTTALVRQREEHSHAENMPGGQSAKRFAPPGIGD